MNITDIKIRRTYQDTRLRALVSLTLDNALAVHDIKVIEGPERLFVAMPSRRDESGVFRDIVHPITAETRRMIEDSILSAYHEHLTAQQAAQELEEKNAARAKEHCENTAPTDASGFEIS